MSYFGLLAATLQAFDRLALADLRALVLDTARAGGTLYLAGNGGSHATAQHWALDLTKQGGMRAVALGCNAGLLTAWANDDSYTYALGRELAAHARPGDALVCLSCSGTSPNIVAALRQAKDMRLLRALITGRQAAPVAPASVLVAIPQPDYGVLEDCFMAIGHWLTKEVAGEQSARTSPA